MPQQHSAVNKVLRVFVRVFVARFRSVIPSKMSAVIPQLSTRLFSRVHPTNLQQKSYLAPNKHEPKRYRTHRPLEASVN